MRRIALALVAAAALAGFAQAQTAAQTPAAAPAASTPAAAPAGGNGKLSHDCKEEVKKACGRAHGDEMKDCIKSSLDLNKFSAACKTQLTQSAKPSG